MEIQHGSLVDTVIEYASVKFGVELPVEQVSQQLRGMSFSQQVNLASAIKQENDDEFSSMVDMSAVNEAGSSAGVTPGAVRAQATAQKNNERDWQLGTAQVAPPEQPAPRTIAGGNKQATGVANRAPNDVQGQNAQATQQNAQGIEQLSSEIERLKQLAMGKR